ncbi:TBC1 domain family member 16 [Sorex araneus]|uniref:TBC1 domain family member 16 n=1 Tax=Sorex araneus TaxID=42254 RepID=UPI0024337CAA|nr:TBC1 domain family member 16 [Sorex araneus]
MSLGRLLRLRRASARTSELLTGTAGGAPSSLDGEIVYSKNNVCVHPPEGLHGLGEHHPGYLCLYAEKDELLGATLILAWVPNARIQRQDEEALRYVTPEGSPVHRGPRARARRAQSSGAPPPAPRDDDILAVARSLQDSLAVEGPSLDLSAGLEAGPAVLRLGRQACRRRGGRGGPCLLLGSAGRGPTGPLSPRGAHGGLRCASAKPLRRGQAGRQGLAALGPAPCLFRLRGAGPGEAAAFLPPPPPPAPSSLCHSDPRAAPSRALTVGSPGSLPTMSGSGPWGTPADSRPCAQASWTCRDGGCPAMPQALLAVETLGQWEPRWTLVPWSRQPPLCFIYWRGPRWASSANACGEESRWPRQAPPAPACQRPLLPPAPLPSGQPAHAPGRQGSGQGLPGPGEEGPGRAQGVSTQEGSPAPPRCPLGASPWAAVCADADPRTPRWDEPQRACALEQICGVFRVDLGQMRSLRLFFSDEACTSGQLVVASRESQYKVLHFHHGGLGKLSDVFQQWKYCTETHLQDQAPEQRLRMQFSIRRPKLPSAETHPEESMYRRLDVAAWLGHLNAQGQVQEEHRLRKAIFFGGIEVSIRGEVWPFLLGYYSPESTSEEREALRRQKQREYAEIQQKRLSMSPEEHSAFWRNVQVTVDKDVVRTDRTNQFFRGDGNPNVEIMRRILLNYAVFSPAIGYSQGMSDLVAPLLAEVLDEADTFWCFVGLMQNTIFVSSPRDEDMETQLLYLRELLRLALPRFHRHLEALGEDGLQLLFCHRWLLLCFKREFPEPEALRIWEACWAHYQTDYFHLFICVAIVAIYGDDVIEQQLPTDQMLLHFGNLAMHMNGELVLRKARSLLYQFRLLARIPCSLCELCRLCGPGMWDSGYIPAVECTGHHPAPESCPYGGTVEAPSPKPPQDARKDSKLPREGFGFRR